MRPWLSSTFFWFFLVLSLLLFFPFCLLAPLMPWRWRWCLSQIWCATHLATMRKVCGITFHFEGLEHLPSAPFVVFAKHQSAWETIAFPSILPPFVWALKRELFWVPIFGWYLALMKNIGLRREHPRLALRRLLRQGKQRLQQGLVVVVFPQGTRIKAGDHASYKRGAAALAIAAGVPLVPVVHNAGSCWPPRHFLLRPGRVSVVIGRPLVATGSSDSLTVQAADWIEGHPILLQQSKI